MDRERANSHESNKGLTAVQLREEEGSQLSSLPRTPLSPDEITTHAMSPTEPQPGSSAMRKKKRFSEERRKKRSSGNTTLTMFNMMQRLKSEREKDRESKKFAVLQKSKDSLCHLENAMKLNEAMQPDAAWRQLWDSLLLVFMLYYWLVVPLLYVTPRDEFVVSSGLMTAIEIVASMVFCADICLAFNTSCVEKSTGIIISDKKKIKLHYLFGSFTFDVMSAIPFDLIVLLVFNHSSDVDWIYLLAAHLRLLKIFKYGQLFSIVNSMKLEANTVQFHYAVLPYVKMAFSCIISLHCITVMFMLLNKDSTFVTSYGIEEEYTYTTCLYWTLYTVSSVGYGDVVIDTPWKRRFASALFVVGVVLHGVVISEISLRMQKGDVKSERRDTMKETLNIMSEFSIPEELQKEVFAFQYHRLHSSLGGQFMRVLATLPRSMRNRIDLYVRVKFICKVPMFASQDFACLVSLANGLKNVIFEPEEVIIKAGDEGAEMYFLSHGFGDVLSPEGEHWGVVRPGGFFGEIALLTEAKRNATIRALTYCDLFILEKDKFVEIVETFPELGDTVRLEVEKRKTPKTAEEKEKEERELAEKTAREQEDAAAADTESEKPARQHTVSIREYGNELTADQPEGYSDLASTPRLSDTSIETDMLDTTCKTNKSLPTINPLSPEHPLSQSEATKGSMHTFKAFSPTTTAPQTQGGGVPVMTISPPAPPPTRSSSNSMPEVRLERLEERMETLIDAVTRIEHMLLVSRHNSGIPPLGPPPPPPHGEPSPPESPSAAPSSSAKRRSSIRFD